MMRAFRKEDDFPRTTIVYLNISRYHQTGGRFSIPIHSFQFINSSQFLLFLSFSTSVTVSIFTQGPATSPGIQTNQYILVQILGDVLSVQGKFLFIDSRNQSLLGNYLRTYISFKTCAIEKVFEVYWTLVLELLHSTTESYILDSPKLF